MNRLRPGGTRRQALVVGAGIGGLTASIALADAGFDVAVVEQAKALGEIGAGVQLAANATRVLEHLGLGDALAAIGVEPTGKEIRLWSTGQRWPLFDLGAASRERWGHPYYTLHRADLHAVLLDGLGRRVPDAIRLDAQVIAVDVASPRPSVTLRDGTRIEADVVIGADGVHSPVRAAVAGPDRPIYSGCTAWRGVIAMDRLPTHLRSAVGVNWVGAGRHVVHYPLRGGTLMNFVGIVEKPDWVAESWTQRGAMDDCLADFVGWHDDVRTLIRAIDAHYLWALMVREPLHRWVAGHVALLGDAAHPTLPFLAQGAGMAIEDGLVLARALQAFDDVPTALAAYRDARHARTARVVRGSADNARRFHNPRLADADGAAAYVATEWQPGKVDARYRWLFEYRADEVALEAAAA